MTDGGGVRPGDAGGAGARPAGSGLARADRGRPDHSAGGGAEGRSRSGRSDTGRIRRTHSLYWHGAVAVAGVVAILIAGAVVILHLIHGASAGSGGIPAATGGSGMEQARAIRLLGGLVLLTALFLAGIFRWIRHRILDELESLVALVEEEDPDRPGGRVLPPMGVGEFERLRQAFTRFLGRFAASRARQEEAEGTLGSVVEHAADAILVLDRSHRIVSWNRGAEETFGFPPSEIVGQPYASLIPVGDEEPELSTPLAPGSTVKDLRTRRLRRDGSTIDVSLTRSRIPASEDREERIVEIVRDISATRRLEEELLRTEKMAAVGKISSKVVHEIRNPLASINLNVDLIRDFLIGSPGGADPEAEEVVGAIKREIRRLSQITDEYLQFSRLPLAAFRRERVNDILVELYDFMRPSIHKKGIRLVLNLDERDPEAVCDATLLRQALLNLLRNAVDATEGQRGQIQIGTRAISLEEAAELGLVGPEPGRGHGAEPEPEPEPDPGRGPKTGPGSRSGPESSATGGEKSDTARRGNGAGTDDAEEAMVGPGAVGDGSESYAGVEISVADNGRGIPGDQLNRIFEPFFTTKKDGTGLGLALVMRAVEEHRGKIACMSVPGRGTTFRLIVPVVPASGSHPDES